MDLKISEIKNYQVESQTRSFFLRRFTTLSKIMQSSRTTVLPLGYNSPVQLFNHYLMVCGRSKNTLFNGVEPLDDGVVWIN